MMNKPALHPASVWTALSFTKLIVFTSVTCAIASEHIHEEQDPHLLCTIEEASPDSQEFPWELVDLAEEMAAGRLRSVANFTVNRTILSEEEIFDLLLDGCASLDRRCSVIITIASCPYLLALDAWTSEHYIPHIMLDLDLTPCPAVSSTSIHLMPPRHLRSEIMRLLVQKIWKWKEILFIYDNFLDTESMTDLKATLHSLSVSTYLVHVEQDMPSSKLARILKSSINTHYIFVAAKSGVFAEIINQAYPLGTLSKDYKWMIMSDGSCPQLLGRRELRRSNVLLLRATHLQKEAYRLCGRINSFTNSSQIYPWAHLLSAGMEAFLRRSLKYSLQESVLNSRTICDVSLRSKRKKTISTVSNEVIVSNYGDVTFSPDTGSVSSFGYDLCSADDGSKNGYSDVGSWSPSYGLKVDGGSLFKNDFTDFGGRKLLIGSQVAKPFVMKRQEGNRTIYEGFSIELLKELASRLNFTYEIVEPPDRLWGAPESNGSWNGIVGMVMRGEIEFGVGPLTITGVRQSVIDFTSPYTEDGIGILTKRPDLDSEAMFRLFKPLQPIVWACLGASIAGVSMLLYLANRYSPFSARHYTRTGQDRLTLFSCFWAILGSTMDQGTDIHPRSVSGRFVMGFWWLFTIILISTYTANMAAVLTITIYDKPINSLAELAGQSEIKPLVKTGTNLYTLFKEATHEIYKDVWRKMGSMPVVTSNEEALQYVLEGDTAYMTDKSQLEYVLLNDCETYALAEEVFNTGGMGFVLPKKAAFLDSFNLIIMKLLESGLIDRWRRKWWSNKGGKCNGSGSGRVSSVNQLDLQYMAGPFFIVLGAMVLSSLFVLVERTCLIDRCVTVRRGVAHVHAAFVAYCRKRGNKEGDSS